MHPIGDTPFMRRFLPLLLAAWGLQALFPTQFGNRALPAACVLLLWLCLGLRFPAGAGILGLLALLMLTSSPARQQLPPAGVVEFLQVLGADSRGRVFYRRWLPAGGNSLRPGGRLLGRELLPATAGELLRCRRADGQALFFAPKARNNPAGFSEQRWLESLSCVARIPSGRTVCETSGRRVPLLLQDRIWSWRQGLLRKAGEHLGRGLHPATAAFLGATLLGQRAEGDGERRLVWQEGGLAHLLALSGLHVALLVLVARSVLDLFPLPHLTRSLLLMMLLGAWLLLVGAPASALRAVAMAWLLLLGRSLERPTDAMHSLLLVFSLNLLLAPHSLLQPGFQLSYAAVASLLLGASGNRTAGALGWLALSLRTSLLVSFATAGLLLHHFHFLALGGILLNLAAIPLCALVLCTALLRLLVPLPMDPLAALLDAGSFLLDAMALAGSTFGGRITPSLSPGIALSLTPLALLWLARKRILPAVRPPLLLALLVLVPVALEAGQRLRSRGQVEILALDVGQGDATLLRLKGAALLIDAGARGFGRDAGRDMLPLLRRLCPRGLDALVLTHPDADHLGGAPALLRGLPVRAVYNNGEWRDNQLNRELKQLCDSLALPVRPLYAGELLWKDAGLRLQVLGPPEEGLPSGNERSVILRLQHESAVALLCGDAGFPAEAWLENWGDWLRADLLKLGHHGSAHSSSTSFLDAVDARQAFYSCDRRNRYGHPAAEALQRCDRQSIPVHGTDHEGALWYRSTGHQWKLLNWRKGE